MNQEILTTTPLDIEEVLFSASYKYCGFFFGVPSKNLRDSKAVTAQRCLALSPNESRTGTQKPNQHMVALGACINCD